MTYLAGAVPGTAAWGLGLWPTLGLFAGIPLATVLAIVAAVYAPSWFARQREHSNGDSMVDGYTSGADEQVTPAPDPPASDPSA
ncbi:MAG: hypothetical protein ACRDRN_27375 [Sciscionella sp.]